MTSYIALHGQERISIRAIIKNTKTNNATKLPATHVTVPVKLFSSNVFLPRSVLELKSGEFVTKKAWLHVGLIDE